LLVYSLAGVSSATDSDGIRGGVPASTGLLTSLGGEGGVPSSAAGSGSTDGGSSPGSGCHDVIKYTALSNCVR